MIKNKKIFVLNKEIIHYIYKTELSSDKIDIDDAFENYNLDTNDIKKLEFIKVRYLYYKNIIVVFLKKNWKWERVLPLERAILIFGAFELEREKENSALVINKIINYSKLYLNDSSYKYINAILQKIKDYYEKKNK